MSKAVRAEARTPKRNVSIYLFHSSKGRQRVSMLHPRLHPPHLVPSPLVAPMPFPPNAVERFQNKETPEKQKTCARRS